jgi:hypothetical protein
MTYPKESPKPFFWIILLFFNCTSFGVSSHHNIQRINSSLALFLDQEPIKCQPEIENETLVNLMSSLRVKEKKIFSENESNLIPEEVSDWRLNTPLTIGICNWHWVWKEEDQNLPGTRIFRTHIELSIIQKTIMITLHEYKQSIQFQNQYTFSDWAQLGISSSNPPDLSFQGMKQLFGYQIIREDRKFIFKPENSTPNIIQNKTPDSIEEKLIELKSWFDRGLISEEEYKKLKKDILEKYKN